MANTEYAYPLERKRVAVKVQRINSRSAKYKIIPDSICFIKEGVLVSERSNSIITDEDGNEIKPEGKFLWTVETIDPFHLVTDIF